MYNDGLWFWMRECCIGTMSVGESVFFWSESAGRNAEVVEGVVIVRSRDLFLMLDPGVYLRRRHLPFCVCDSGAI